MKHAQVQRVDHQLIELIIRSMEASEPVYIRALPARTAKFTLYC